MANKTQLRYSTASDNPMAVDSQIFEFIVDGHGWEGKDLPSPSTTTVAEIDPFLVRIDEDDPAHPRNFSNAKKWYLTMLSGILVLNTSFASSAPVGAIILIVIRFKLTELLATLTVSLFVMGYMFGPLLWGPLSEVYGRRPIFIIPLIFNTIVQAGTAFVPNKTLLLVFRFLGGFFAAAPLTNCGAQLGDIWAHESRGKALSFFALGPFAGPTVAPLVTGFMTVSLIDWRWTFWMLSILAGVCTIFAIFTIPETHVPRLEELAAKKKRKETGDNRYYAATDNRRIPFSQALQLIVGKPFKILFSEPMLMAITLYQSFIYGCLYLLFAAYPMVFGQGHHLNSGYTGLTYLPITIGGFCGCFSYIFFWNPRYMRYVKEFAPDPVPPEYRLEMAVWATIPYAAAFFWFGWTSYPSLPIWAPLSQGFVMGWAIIWLFLSQLNYVIDAYLFVAASALAANTVVRSIFGATFPLFAHKMYLALDPRWASTVLGLFALALVPIPFVLIRYGPALRAKSRYIPKKEVDPSTLSTQSIIHKA